MLRIENVAKKYGSFTAVNNLSLEIKEGEIFGFVGPNGAGKTTTLKMIATLLEPTSGKIYIDDVDITKDLRKVRSKMGYMPDFFGVYDDLKVEEYLEFYSDLAEISKDIKEDTINDLLELVDLSHKRDAYVDTLSRGMKQRLCLARSLVHNPKLLILDEPASGMDPRARFQMKEILRELKKMGKTILISSHILPELAELCTSIGIIENGQIITSGTVNEIMAKLNKTNLIKIKVLDQIEKTIKLIKEQPFVENVYNNDDYIEVEINGEEKEIIKLLKVLVTNDASVLSFTNVENNLEDIFMQVTKGDTE